MERRSSCAITDNVSALVECVCRNELLIINIWSFVLKTNILKAISWRHDFEVKAPMFLMILKS